MDTETYTGKVYSAGTGMDIHQEEAAPRLEVSLKHVSSSHQTIHPPSMRFTSIRSPTFITLIKGPSSAVTVW